MTDGGQGNLRWRFGLGLVAAFLVPFAIYLPTVYPTYCFFSDSGDFIAAGELLMLAHPTGYPWFCLLGKLFAALVPVGEVAWRYGLLTMLFVPLTSVVTYLLLMELTDHAPISVATAWTIAFGATLWYSSVAAEVYSSNLFLTMLVLYALVRFWKTGDKRWFYTAGLTVGWGAAHHLTLPLMVAGGLVGMVLAWRWLPRRPTRRDWIVALLIAWLPLFFYAYLPLRAPKLYGYRLWQLTGDDPSKSVQDFVKYVLGLRFRYMMGAVPLKERPIRFAAWVRQGVSEYSFLFLLGLIFGWLVLLRFLAFGLITLGMWVTHLAFYLGYAVPDIVYFYIPGWSLTVLWGGLSLFVLWDWARRYHWSLAVGLLAFAFVGAEMTAFQGWSLAWNEDKQRGRRYLETVLAQTPQNAALLVSIDDVLFHLYAIQAVENKRPDVLVVSVYQWQPTLLLQRQVATTTADLYRFFNPYPWHLHPLTPWVGVLDTRLPLEAKGNCQEHDGEPTVHESRLIVPPDGVHIGTLLVAEVTLCADSYEAAQWGYLWLLRRTDVPIAEETGPNASAWGWWWFYQPLAVGEGEGRTLIRLRVGVPFVSIALPGYYEVRGLLYPRWKPLPTTAEIAKDLWAKGTLIGVVEGWGR